MMTSVCITWEYCTTTHFNPLFGPKANLIGMLWCMDNYTHDGSYVNDEVRSHGTTVLHSSL